MNDGGSDPPPATTRPRRGFWPRGLSGKLLILTTFFIMLVEILVFIPSVSNYRLTWLSRHFTTGEAAAVAIERVGDEAATPELRSRLLDLTETEVIAIRRDGVSRILASRSMPSGVDKHVELAEPGRVAAVGAIKDALDTLVFGGERTIRVFGRMQDGSGVLELVMPDRLLRQAMLSYAGNVLLISLMISLATAMLVFVVLRWFLIRPLQRMMGSMVAFSNDPENPDRIIKPSGRDDEIGIAEEQLEAMQKTVGSAVTQQRSLASLGLAVSKINHDLRNILASASLFSDRLEDSADPTVQRLAPRLIKALGRAVNYTRAVLSYGKAGESTPRLGVVNLHRLMEDVAETLALDLESPIAWRNNVPQDAEVVADPDHLYRVFLNLGRNAVQVMSDPDMAGGDVVKRLSVEFERDGQAVCVRLKDTGPGIKPEARETLFTAFNRSGRNGGTGLGLAIAHELVLAHGGSLRLVDHPEPGACFEIRLPSGRLDDRDPGA